ncbi:MAG: alpha/beta fold hydrolase [Gemmatimonadota bacterium]|nr:alpha/beta fold hydrolase [Gemmatimonadota bacterium]
MRRISALALALLGLAASVAAQTSAAINKQRVTYKSGDLTLVGFVYKPAGAGPFPTVIWNHGSEQNPGGGPQFDSVAAVFLPAGYALFAPTRRGHGESEGKYIRDALAQVMQSSGREAFQRETVHLLETEQLDDQLAGLAYAKHLVFVDTNRLVVAGCSYGGIQTLLGAERGVGYKAAISISPAALSWEGVPPLRDRLVKAVAKITVPVFLIQPPKDASLEPSRVIGAEFKRLGKQYTGKIYPETGPEDEQTHCFGGAKGMHVWASDARAFLAGVIK